MKTSALITPLQAHRAASASPRHEPARRFDTRQLFDGATEIEIVHDQAVYRLKITRQGKLILNK